MPCHLFDTIADRITYGHRTLSRSENSLGKAITVTDSSTFFTQLTKEGNVIVDSTKRSALIRHALAQHKQTSLDMS